MFALTATRRNIRQFPLWKRQLAAAAACLMLLLAGMIVPATAGIGLLVLASVIGMRYPLAESIESLRSGKLDVDFLMLLVAVGAWVIGHPAEGVFLLVLFTASRGMESFAEERTTSAIEALSSSFPNTALRISADGTQEEVASDQLLSGDRIVILPGAFFPVDVVVRQGFGSADASALTGEQEPRAIAPGEEVPSGAVNGSSRLVAEVSRPARESAYQKILALVENADSRRSNAQVWSDRAGRWFTVVILAAAGLGITKWLWVDGLSAQVATYRAMALLVAGSPCALVLSVPSAVLAGITVGARRGILFHGGRGLLKAGTVGVIAFDKTGTITTGDPRVDRVEGVHADNPQTLAMAYALARSSNHPASRAVADYLSRHRLEDLALESAEEQPGLGIAARFNGRALFLGRPNDLLGETTPMVALAVDGVERLRFRLVESVRPQTSCTIARLRASGRRLALLSGDHTAAARDVARLVGIAEAHGDLRPEDKHRWIEGASASGRVMMVGDGVNDAPALARADVAVAMGMRGSAAALAQADIVLVRDRLPDLVEAIHLSRRTSRIVRQNIFVAVGAAAILVSFALAGNLNLALGVLGHEGGTVLVVLNSLRLLLPERAQEPPRVGQPAALRP